MQKKNRGGGDSGWRGGSSWGVGGQDVGGQGICEQRIEVIVKMPKKKNLGGGGDSG